MAGQPFKPQSPSHCLAPGISGRMPLHDDKAPCNLARFSKKRLCPAAGPPFEDLFGVLGTVSQRCGGVKAPCNLAAFFKKKSLCPAGRPTVEDDFGLC